MTASKPASSASTAIRTRAGRSRGSTIVQFSLRTRISRGAGHRRIRPRRDGRGVAGGGHGAKQRPKDGGQLVLFRVGERRGHRRLLPVEPREQLADLLASIRRQGHEHGPAVTGIPRARDPATSLERPQDTGRGRPADAHLVGEGVRLELAPDPEHPEPHERRPGEPVGRQDPRLQMSPDRGRAPEHVRDRPHRPEVERHVAELFEHLPFGRQEALPTHEDLAGDALAQLPRDVHERDDVVVGGAEVHEARAQPHLAVDERRCEVDPSVGLDGLGQGRVVGVRLDARQARGGSARSRAAAAPPSPRRPPSPALGDRAGPPRPGSARWPRGTDARRGPGRRATPSARGTAASTPA